MLPLLTAPRVGAPPGRVDGPHPHCNPRQLAAVSADWSGWSCREAEKDSAHHAHAINAFSGKAYPHHPIFNEYAPFEGELPGAADTFVDFLGVRMPAKLYCNSLYSGQLLAHAIRTRQCALHEKLHRQPAGATHVPVRVRTSWPVISEEYFEYVDVLTSVSEYIKEVGNAPTRPYTFIELGAGYGHWTLAAHAALKQRYSTRTPAHRYLMVDVVDSLKATVMEMSAQKASRREARLSTWVTLWAVRRAS